MNVFDERLHGQGFRHGGFVHRFSTGGQVPGVGNTDSVRALLTPGEFVVREPVAKKYGGLLKYLNEGGGRDDRQQTADGSRLRFLQEGGKDDENNQKYTENREGYRIKFANKTSRQAGSPNRREDSFDSIANEHLDTSGEDNYSDDQNVVMRRSGGGHDNQGMEKTGRIRQSQERNVFGRALGYQASEMLIEAPGQVATFMPRIAEGFGRTMWDMSSDIVGQWKVGTIIPFYAYSKGTSTISLFCCRFGRLRSLHCFT